jgi:hypothetical protein
MRTAREIEAIIITEEQALDLLARGQGRSVRVTPLKDLDGNWYLAPNVAQEMDRGKTFAYLDDHVTAKREPGVAVILEDEGGEQDPAPARPVRVRRLDGTTVERTSIRDGVPSEIRGDTVGGSR